ncbi:MAG TPA: efflux RND transporter periplasmic adaptor subunit [Steroidobacteraceae bacterium]|jgi:RND family efflux transporter MFP subunit|nr:efflux RND transporter periplasmic adaptor subunit [Steroidobacteraceae bacterium]
MDEKSALLDQLRIDRGAPAPASADKRKLWAAVGFVLLLIAGAAVAWLSRSSGIPVHVVTAQPVGGGESAAGSILDASGYIVARRQATVASKVTAKMVELDIEEGDRVKEGQVIAKLDDSNVRAALDQASAQLEFARASLAETKVNLANARRDYDRQSSLLQNHYVSQATVDNAQTTFDSLQAQLATQESNVDVVSRALAVAQRNEDDTVVRAPFSGIVTVKAAQPGEMVSPISAGGGFTRTGIGTIVDMNSLEIQVDVNENFINRVRTDGRATAKLNAYPDWQIPAHVIAVIPTADRSKGTVTVRLALDQKDARILPEMGVRVSFLADAAPAGGAKAGGVTLPAKAVQAAGSTGAVFVVHDDTVERRVVRLGAGSGDVLTVLSGISAGEPIAVGDFDRLQDGAKIRVEP